MVECKDLFVLQVYGLYHNHNYVTYVRKYIVVMAIKNGLLGSPTLTLQL